MGERGTINLRNSDVRRGRDHALDRIWGVEVGSPMSKSG